MKEVIEFLTNNGFLELTDNVLENSLCTVILHDDHYDIIDKDSYYLYSRDLSIYWLIGVLTYYNLMDKNYKSSINPWHKELKNPEPVKEIDLGSGAHGCDVASGTVGTFKEFKCDDCFDSGCQCGGIGYTCPGCCGCEAGNKLRAKY